MPSSVPKAKSIQQHCWQQCWWWQQQQQQQQHHQQLQHCQQKRQKFLTGFYLGWWNFCPSHGPCPSCCHTSWCPPQEENPWTYSCIKGRYGVFRTHSSYHAGLLTKRENYLTAYSSTCDYCSVLNVFWYQHGVLWGILCVQSTPKVLIQMYDIEMPSNFPWRSLILPPNISKIFLAREGLVLCIMAV